MAVPRAFVATPRLQTASNHHLKPTPVDLIGIGIGIPMMNNGTRRRRRRGLIQKARCELSGSKTPNVSAISAVDRYTRERSSIVVIGLSIHTAPVEMREKLAIPVAEWPRAIAELCGLNHIEEAVVLSTCNRMEIYFLALSRHRGVKEVTEWMSKRSGIPVSEICGHRFLLYNKDATQHLFRVSAGLDSLVLGEGQILAQVKQAGEKVMESGVGGRITRTLFEKAISAGKHVRTETGIAAGAVSVSSAAVELALRKLMGSSSSAVVPVMLVIGAGKMGKLVVRHLVAKGCTQIVVVNRSQEKVAVIREEVPPGVEIIYKPLDEMLACAAEASVIFTSTASETPLLLKEHVEILPPAPRLFVDISVPRNVGSCVAGLDGAEVYNVDDLEEVVAANKEERARKAIEAQGIITEESKSFEAWRDSLQASSTIRKLRGKVERIVADTVETFMSKYGKDMDEKTRGAVKRLTQDIGNRILDGPMRHLRCDGHKSQTTEHEMVENNKALIRMFELDHELLEDKFRTKKVEQKENKNRA